MWTYADWYDSPGSSVVREPDQHLGCHKFESWRRLGIQYLSHGRESLKIKLLLHSQRRNSERNTNLSQHSCNHSLHHKRIPCLYHSYLNLDYMTFCSSGKLVYWFSCMYSLALFCPKFLLLCKLRCRSLPLWNLPSICILLFFQIRNHRDVSLRV